MVQKFMDTNWTVSSTQGIANCEKEETMSTREQKCKKGEPAFALVEGSVQMENL